MGRAQRRALFLAGALGVTALLVLVGAVWLRPEPVGSAASAVPPGDPGAALSRAEPAPRRRDAQAPTAPGPGVSDEEELARQRVQRARDVLERYRRSTQYPPTARPLSEQPDQFLPHFVSPRRLPLAGADEGSKVLLILRQDYYYLAGDEAVTFVVECGTLDGPAPCELLSSVATAEGTELRAEVPFVSGAGGTVHTAVLAPGKGVFAGHHGAIHVELGVRVGDESGGASFDVEYTPRPPAVFTGRVSERMEDGSLRLGVEMEVHTPGRYVLAARVDDAHGRSFAYLSFNDLLPQGRTEAALWLFGKLVRDEYAPAPFRLRDVEGFLLKEDAFPDRELLPTWAGIVHTTRMYAEHEFSTEEWQSEQRERYLRELENDVARAEAALRR